MNKKVVHFLIFVAVANPETIKLVRGVIGKWVSSAEGLPTTTGLLLFALIHVIVTEVVLNLVASKKEYDLDEVPKYISN
jgi:hypothetical protein